MKKVMAKKRSWRREGKMEARESTTVGSSRTQLKIYSHLDFFQIGVRIKKKDAPKNKHWTPAKIYCRQRDNDISKVMNPSCEKMDMLDIFNQRYSVP